MDNSTVIPIKKNGMPSPFKWISIIVPLIIVAILVFNSFTIVQAGTRGVLLQFSAVQKTIYNEGLHFKMPFVQTVIPVDVRVLKSENDASAASKDLQTVTTSIAVNYHVNPEQVNLLFQEVGLGYADTVIKPSIQEVLKAVTARYTAEQLISQRQEVSNEVKDLLEKKLSSYFILLDGINITEFHFSEEFNKAIESKQTAEQNALKAQRDLDRIKIEAEQKIAQAKAEAESLRLQKQEVTPELVQLRQIEAQIKAIEKWDGKLPSTTGSAIPFLNVGK